MRRAPVRVEANKGAVGVDGLSVEALRSCLKEHWPRTKTDFDAHMLVSLLDQLYRIIVPL